MRHVREKIGVGGRFFLEELAKQELRGLRRGGAVRTHHRSNELRAIANGCREIDPVEVGKKMMGPNVRDRGSRQSNL